MQTQKITFEQVMEAMNRMTPEEREARIAELTELCICGSCPTYVETGETELVFCATRRSELIKEERGCLCPGCPVQDKMALRWDYYCLKGSGKELAGL